MTRIADLLDLHGEERDRLWVVASNGAVIFRYPPLEVVHEETFDARAAVAAVLEHHPRALVAVEERGGGGGGRHRVTATSATPAAASPGTGARLVRRLAWYLPAILVFVGTIVLWQVVVSNIHIQGFPLPTPSVSAPSPSPTATLETRSADQDICS